MGDLINFATFEFGAASSCFDGFPFAIREIGPSEVVPGVVGYSVPVPLETLARWWRVKKWLGTVHTLGEPVEDVTFKMTAGGWSALSGVETDTSYPRELEMYPYPKWIKEGETVDPPGHVGSRAEASLLSNGLYPCGRIGGNYYPWFQMFITADFGFANTLIDDEELQVFGPLGGVTIDGSILVPFFNYDDDTPKSATLDPLEYWPFAKPDGSPKYDTTTGAEL